MKQYLPYNVLLIAAVVLTGLMIFYNLVLRDTFAVTIAYKIPGIPQPESVSAVNVPSSSPIEYDEDEYYTDTFDEEKALTSVTFPLDINRATVEELKFIPQVGNVTAQRIVQYRDVIGAYTSLDQLKEIKGISDVSFAKISAYLIIEDSRENPLDAAEENYPDAESEDDDE